jgi:hypothetical protein
MRKASMGFEIALLAGASDAKTDTQMQSIETAK